MKPIVHLCECCHHVITNPYKAKMRVFDLYEEKDNNFFTIFRPRKVVKRVTLCNECYTAMATNRYLKRL